MGKIRIKALGDEKKEKAQKARDEARREVKKAAKMKDKSSGVVVIPGLPEEVMQKQEELAKEPEKAAPTKSEYKPRLRSHRYTSVRAAIDKTKTYPFLAALAIVKKANLTKFDPSIEVHINTLEKNLRGSVVLPHGTGKEYKVTIVTDQILEEVGKGKINFDVLISHPSFMPKLAKLAKILGPRGLMPNPKNGTISDKPEEAAKQFAGKLQYKTEAEFPIIHCMIGKGSFEEKKLSENFSALINSIGPLKIKSVFLKATMSPSVKVNIN